MLKLDPAKVTLPTIRAQDVRRRIAHEFGHKLGIAHFGWSKNSVMHGRSSIAGQRDFNDVVSDDVLGANEARWRSDRCTADPMKRETWKFSEHESRQSLVANRRKIILNSRGLPEAWLIHVPKIVPQSIAWRRSR